MTQELYMVNDKMIYTLTPISPRNEREGYENMARLKIPESSIDGYKAYVDSTYENKREFLLSGLNENTGVFEDLPLLIQNVVLSTKERTQLTPVIGDYFDYVSYGRSIYTVNVSATLLDNLSVLSVPYIMFMFADYFRITQVSRIKIPLGIKLPGVTLYGAITSMSISKSSSNNNIATVNFGMIILEVAYSANNMIEIYGIPKEYGIRW